MRGCARRTLAMWPAPRRGPARTPPACPHCGRWRSALLAPHESVSRTVRAARWPNGTDRVRPETTLLPERRDRGCASPQPNRHAQRSHPRYDRQSTNPPDRANRHQPRRRQHHRGQRRVRRPAPTAAGQPCPAHRPGRSPARGPRPAAPDEAAVPGRTRRARSHAGAPRAGRGRAGIHIGRCVTHAPVRPCRAHPGPCRSSRCRARADPHSNHAGAGRSGPGGVHAPGAGRAASTPCGNPG